MPRSLYRLMYWLMPRLAVLAVVVWVGDWVVKAVKS
jgi:hypothetical protein